MQSLQEDDLLPALAKRRVERANPFEQQQVPSKLGEERFAKVFDDVAREERHERVTLRRMEKRPGDSLLVGVLQKRGPVEVRGLGERLDHLRVAADNRANQFELRIRRMTCHFGVFRDSTMPYKVGIAGRPIKSGARFIA